MPAQEADSPGGTYMPPTPGTPGGFDRQKYGQLLEAIDPQKGLAYQQSLAKPTKELSKVENLSFQGKPVTVAFYKDGSREVLPFDPAADKQEVWEDIPQPKGAAPGLQWQRSKTTGQLRSVGSQPPVTNINLGAPKYESGVGFVYPPSDKNPTGQVVIPQGMPEKVNKPPVEYLKQLSGMTNLNTAVQEYVGGLKNWDVTSIVNPSAVAEMGTKYNNMMLQAKEAYNLGVLNGPDYMILQQVVTNPASLKGTITTNSALGNQAEELARIMRRNAANLAKVHGQPVPDIGPVGTPTTTDPRATGGKIGGSMPASSGRSYKSATMPKLDELPDGSEVVDDKTGITLVKRNGKWEKR
jgi:hypothetical protein